MYKINVMKTQKGKNSIINRTAVLNLKMSSFRSFAVLNLKMSCLGIW